MPKLAQISLRTVKRYDASYVSFLILFLSLNKTNRFHVAWVCSVIDHRGRQNVVKNISDTVVCGSCGHFLPHFDVICDLLLNRRTATLNLFVK